MGQCCLTQAIGCARNLLEALCRDSSEEEARKADRIRSGTTKRRRPTPLRATHELEGRLRGDTKTLFHALDLLERLMPIATFMDFCTELEELRLQGARNEPSNDR